MPSRLKRLAFVSANDGDIGREPLHERFHSDRAGGSLQAQHQRRTGKRVGDGAGGVGGVEHFKKSGCMLRIDPTNQ